MKRSLFAVLICFICLPAISQEVADTSSIQKIPLKYFDAVNKKAENLTHNLDKKSQKVLASMQKQEARLQKKLAKIDSIAANNIFSKSAEKYNAIKEKLKNPGNLSQYIPKIDNLATSLKFLDQHPDWMNNIENAKEKLAEANDKLKEFQNKLKNAEDIKQFLKERKQFLKEQLEKFGLVKELKKINKEVYYYSQQINEYKEIFKDSKKAEQKALELLSKTKLFKDFMKKNSMLASLFPMPGGNISGQTPQTGFAALQTRVQINNFIQQAGMGVPNGATQLQQNINSVQSQVTQMRNAISRVIGGGGDLEMPDFKYNSQKTKSFFKRIELGTNFQAQKTDNFFPSTTDLALSAGYKLNDKSLIGVGMSHKLGWGTGWDNIEITHQGIGLRSFADIKLKGSFWISGGYEMNYRQEINDIIQLRDQTAWQKSGLIGVSKIISVKSKIFKKSKVQMLWDFLSYQQRPRTPALLFRIGYNF